MEGSPKAAGIFERAVEKAAGSFKRIAEGGRDFRKDCRKGLEDLKGPPKVAGIFGRVAEGGWKF